MSGQAGVDAVPQRSGLRPEVRIRFWLMNTALCWLKMLLMTASTPATNLSFVLETCISWMKLKSVWLNIGVRFELVLPAVQLPVTGSWVTFTYFPRPTTNTGACHTLM